MFLPGFLWWYRQDAPEGKGADRGVDLLYFYESKEKRRKIIVQVKSGGVRRGDPDKSGLLGEVNNQKAAGGILLTFEELTNHRLRVEEPSHLRLHLRGRSQ